MHTKLLAVIAGVTLALLGPAVPAYGFGLPPPSEPGNTTMPGFTACQGGPAVQAASVACTSQVLDAIDAQHTAEGIGPLVLPAGFTTEPVTKQLLQVIGAERASRG